MIFKNSDKVVVIGTNMTGSIGYIFNELFPFVNATSAVYTLKQDENSNVQGIFENKTFRPDELTLIARDNHSNFDFTRYLTEQQVTAIAEKVCEKRVGEYIEEVLRNRTYAGGSIVDQILIATVKLYSEKLAVNFEDDFLKRCKEEIHRDIPINDNETAFRDHLAYALQNEAKKYIEANSELLQSEMKNTIHDQASMLSTDKVAWLISQKINIKDIILQVIKEGADKPST